MANKGKYIIGIRLLLLKDFLQANAGRDRIITRRQIEAYLTERGYPVEKKTLYTDFAILESKFDLQLEYDVHTGTVSCRYGGAGSKNINQKKATGRTETERTD